MKKITLVLLSLIYLNIANGQVLSVFDGLRLHLKDADVNFVNSSGSLPAQWNESSGNGNHMVGFSVSASPSYNAALNGVQFDGLNDMMQNQAINNHFQNPNFTMFAVRIATTSTTINSGSFWNTLLTVSQNGTFNNEFGLYGNWAIHHTTAGNWTHRTHQCYNTLPNNLPVILSGKFGSGIFDLEYYVNGIQSTNSILTTNSPSTHTTLNRRVYLGGRFNASGEYATEFFNGTVLEVLIYDRILNDVELENVHQYLYCKYNIIYESCTNDLLIHNCLDEPEEPEEPFIPEDVIDTLRVGFCDGSNYIHWDGTVMSEDTVFTETYNILEYDSIVTYIVTKYASPNIYVDVIYPDEELCILDSIQLIPHNALNYYIYNQYYELLNVGSQMNVLLSQYDNQFIVVGENEYGCSDTFTLNTSTQSCCDLIVPNAFSPNGDGLNDYFGPVSKSNFPKYTLLVFDRWGNKVFESFNKNVKWNGSFGNTGSPVNTGVYFWSIFGQCYDGSTLYMKGDVSVIR